MSTPAENGALDDGPGCRSGGGADLPRNRRRARAL
jgi:hypothetical protein